MTTTDPAPAAARRRRWPRLLVLGVVLVVAAVVLAGRLSAGGADGRDGGAPSALLGRPAPSLSGATLDGGSFDLAGWHGQVVLVNLWASWCAPCRQELPLLASAYSALHPRGLQIVGIDVKDGTATAKAFLQQHGDASWPSVVDTDGQRAVDWGAFGLPETYLLDRSGKVVAKATGAVDAQWIDEHVLPLLRGGGQ